MWLRAWYKGATWLYLLWPLSLLFRLLARLRRIVLQARAEASPLPTVVVGNISLGGTGKTPLVIALVKALQARGYRPGVVSRGYGGRLPEQPYRLRGDESPALAGDEALLIRRQCDCPVMLGPDRAGAVRALAESGECDVLISDDGLQHYAMARDVEIVVIDGIRGLGNELCLPAGPLREPPSRIAGVDHVVFNGHSRYRLPARPRDTVSWMRLQPTAWVNLRSGQRLAPGELPVGDPPSPLQALAGIGHPDRFFDLLSSLGYGLQRHEFDDHHAYTAEDLVRVRQAGDGPVVMTEKDAVKCDRIADEHCWYLQVEAVIDGMLPDAIEQQLSLSAGQQ